MIRDHTGNMEEKKHSKSISFKELRPDPAHLILGAALCVFFFAILAVYGSPVYNDSDQYIQMHVHREPVYPLLLWLCRCLFPGHSLTASSFLQSVICIIAPYRFVTYIEKRFDLKKLWDIALYGLVIAPYVVTPMASKLHVQMSVAVMSESIAIPLFLLFIVAVHDAVSSDCFSVKKLAAAFILTLILILTRSQMIFTLVLWLIAAVYVCVYRSEKNAVKTVLIRIAVCLLVFICGFIAKDTVTRTYNLVFNGRYVDSVYSHINLLANILYVADRDMGESIEDTELRDIFYEIYDKADGAGLLYTCSEDRVVYLEEVHDRIKYDCIEYGLRDIVERKTGIHDYIEYNRIADGYAGELIHELLPQVFGRWFTDALLLGSRGVVRNIAVCHPVMYIYTAFMLGIMIFFALRGFKADPGDKTTLFMFIAILSVLGNAYSTAIVIMCLSRYMIYGFPVFYTAVLLLLIGIKRKRNAQR